MLKHYLKTLFNAKRIHYLRVVVLLVKRDLKLKYRDSVFGYMWSMINPLLWMMILSTIFSKIFKAGEGYHIKILAGYLLWNMINISLNIGTMSIISGGGLLKKIKMPIWVLPATALGTAVINFLLALIPFFIVFFASGYVPDIEIILLPLVLFLLIIFLIGLLLILSTLNVFFRDIGHILEPSLQMLFYATPILYDRERLIEHSKILFIINLNPFTHYLEVFKKIMIGSNLYKQSVSIYDFIPICLFSTISIIIGFIVYKKIKFKIMFKV